MTYRIDLYTIKFDQDANKFSNLEVIQIPLEDEGLESILEIVYGFEASGFGITTKDVSPVALAIIKNEKPVVLADIKVVERRHRLEWREPLIEKQLDGVRLWRADLIKSADAELDALEKEHLETQIELIDVIIANGANYCVPYKRSMTDIKKVKKNADSGKLARIVIVGEVGFWGPQRTGSLKDPSEKKSKVQKMSIIGQVRDALVFGPKEMGWPGRDDCEETPEPETPKTTPAKTKSDISGDAPFVATIFFAGIDPRTGLVLNREDVQVASSTSLRKVIEACQSANPTFMKGVGNGQAPILIQVESGGKLVALADVKREPVKAGFFVKWREPLTPADLADLKSKAGQLSWGSMSSMLREKSVSFDIQLEAANILLKGTEFSVEHEKFMEIANEVSAEPTAQDDSFSPGW
jgi:hypothetical protein